MEGWYRTAVAASVSVDTRAGEWLGMGLAYPHRSSLDVIQMPVSLSDAPSRRFEM